MALISRRETGFVPLSKLTCAFLCDLSPSVERDPNSRKKFDGGSKPKVEPKVMSFLFKRCSGNEKRFLPPFQATVFSLESDTGELCMYKFVSYVYAQVCVVNRLDVSIRHHFFQAFCKVF